MTPLEGGIEIRTIRAFFLWHIFHHLTPGVRLSRGFFRMTPLEMGVIEFCTIRPFVLWHVLQEET